MIQTNLVEIHEKETLVKGLNENRAKNFFILEHEKV